MTRRIRAGAALALAAPVLAAVAAAPATAAAPPSKPAFTLTQTAGSKGLVLGGARGRVLTGTVTVTNVSTRPVTVVLRPADIRNSANGNANYVTGATKQTGRWLTLQATSVRLPTGSARTVQFTVTIPRDAGSGSHYGGIVGFDKADLSVSAEQAKANKRKGFVFSRVNRQALPVTVRLPGALTRTLRLRSTRLIVQPAGAALQLRLVPGGTTLTQSARIRLSITRGARTIFNYAATLGQLFPGGHLDVRVPWRGSPTAGSYHVAGTIRPEGGKVIQVDQTVKFTPSAAKRLQRVTPQFASADSGGVPIWVWPVLGLAVALLIGLSLTVIKLARRPPVAPTT